MNRKLMKEQLLNIMNNSYDETLAYNEAAFILDTLYSGEEMVLSDNELEKIAGGNGGKKYTYRTLAAILSLGILGGNMNAATSSSVGGSIKKFAKNHPKITRGISIAGTGAAIGLAGWKTAQYIGSKIQKKDVPKEIENMNDEEVHIFLKEQIKKLHGRGHEERYFFYVDLDLIDNCNPRILAVVVATVNEILDKIPQLERAIIDYAKTYDSRFLLSFSTEKDALGDTTMMAHYRQLFPNKYAHFGIHINPSYGSNSMVNIKTIEYAGVLSRFHPPVRFNRLIESTITHEMGHVFSNFIAKPWLKLGKEIINLGCEQNFFPNDPALFAISENIKQYLQSKYKLTSEEMYVSGYGETNEEEWFAEAFSQLYQGDPDANSKSPLMSLFNGVIEKDILSVPLNFEEIYIAYKNAGEIPGHDIDYDTEKIRQGKFFKSEI